MSEASKRRKQEKILRMDQAVILGAACLIGGFFLGLGTYHMTLGTAPAGSTPPPTIAAGQSAPPPTISGPGSTMPNYGEQIRELKKIVEVDATNYKAWVQLGNVYFDSGQPTESIAAYSQALALDGTSPNVITDRGIMYRQIKDFPSAVTDFRKASELDSMHLNSSFNLGLTLLHDLGDTVGAIAAWENYLTRNPPAEAATQMRERLDAMQVMLEQEKAGQPK